MCCECTGVAVAVGAQGRVVGTLGGANLTWYERPDALWIQRPVRGVCVRVSQIDRLTEGRREVAQSVEERGGCVRVCQTDRLTDRRKVLGPRKRTEGSVCDVSACATQSA